MSEKLNHSDLSAMLAKEAGLSVAKADTFTKALFDIIIEGLEQDGIVKINGLGTFKVTDVADRSSVNVNTGEKIEIKGHRKLTFLPAESLKECVNRPFAMFEPVEIDDTYQEDADAAQDEETIENEEAAESVVTADEEKAKEPSAEEAETATEPQDEEPAHVENKEEVAENDNVDADDGPKEEAINEGEKEVAPAQETTEEAVEEENVAPFESSEEEIPATDANDDNPNSKDEAKAEDEKPKEKDSEGSARRGRSGKNALIAIMAIMVLGFAYYWFVNKDNSEANKDNPLVLADTRDQAPTGNQPEKEEEAVQGKTAERQTDSIATVQPGTDISQQTADNVQQQPEAAQPSASAEETTAGNYEFIMLDALAAISDRDITDADTTLYIPVGELAVHVVAEDDRLAKISNDYYGSRKLWPYIAKYNNLKQPYGIMVGMKLAIPELRPKE